MCGIFLLLNNKQFSFDMIQNQFNKGKHRGPEYSYISKLWNEYIIGFHRLAINGLDEQSNQPFCFQETILVCNGEIYNYSKLYQTLGITPETNSDCEVIIHLYRQFGIVQTLQMLDGVFSFVLCDLKTNTVYVARDPYGVRPLYSLHNPSTNLIGFASELKMLNDFTLNETNHLDVDEQTIISQFKPGTYQTIELIPSTNNWRIVNKSPYTLVSNFSTLHNYQNITSIYENISFYLQNAVNKRCETTDRPIACLLSGGLDSSLITALVNEYYKKSKQPKQLETYSIGLADSEDLKYAKIVATYLGTKHTEIILTEDDFFNAIPEVIYNIESYDTTTVRASIGNYLLGQYISKHSEAKVIFNGDGSDELTGGYLYMSKAPNSIEFDKETRRLLQDIHLFDVLRSDKSISSHGLEPRTPFLDRAFTQYYLSIPMSLRFHTLNQKCEKFLLRQSFDQPYFYNLDGQSLLPHNILWRKKEAFSDGVSSHGRSLFTILQEKIEDQIISCKDAKYYSHLPPTTNEQFYYRYLFDCVFNKQSNIVPYFWMPKYINATDPSARTLDIYNKAN